MSRGEATDGELWEEWVEPPPHLPPGPPVGSQSHKIDNKLLGTPLPRGPPLYTLRRQLTYSTKLLIAVHQMHQYLRI